MLVKIVVFDSGLGSLSIIKQLQKMVTADIIYFADQKNFPYGTKSISQLERIITKTVRTLKKEFKPDLIVMGSNTPSILFKKITNDNKVIGVFPPLKMAVKKTNTSSIAILATKSNVESKALQAYIKKNVPKNIQVTRVNASPLVNLVELGKFISNKKLCQEKITKMLTRIFKEKNIDVATLSSTHLPFLLPILQQTFPQITFLDPASQVAKKVSQIINTTKKSKRNKMQIITTGDPVIFQKQLYKLGIKKKIKPFVTV